MSAVARTNLFLSQLIDLHSWSISADYEGRFNSADTAFVLVMEQGLLALIDEVAEPNGSVTAPSSLLAELDKSTSDLDVNFAFRQIRLSGQEMGHWINQWLLARRMLIQQADRLGRVAIDATSLISTTSVEDGGDLTHWLAGFSELVNHCREQQNYY